MRRLVIGPEDAPYITRWRIVATPLGGLYLHRLHRPDRERHLHDHPWPFVSLVLAGGYTEDYSLPPLGLLDRDLAPERRRWSRGSVHRMTLRDRHRITHVEPGTVTLLLVGRKSREWGFWTETGWVPWTNYPYAEPTDPPQRPYAEEPR